MVSRDLASSVGTQGLTEATASNQWQPGPVAAFRGSSTLEWLHWKTLIPWGLMSNFLSEPGALMKEKMTKGTQFPKDLI